PPPPASTILHRPPSPPPSFFLDHSLPPHPDVHHVLHPGPERILPPDGRAVDHVAAPPFHYFRILRPQAHPLSRHLVLPQLGDRRVGVQQAHGPIARQVRDRAPVDPLVAVVERPPAGPRIVRL